MVISSSTLGVFHLCLSVGETLLYLQLLVRKCQRGVRKSVNTVLGMEKRSILTFLV